MRKYLIVLALFTILLFSNSSSSFEKDDLSKEKVVVIHGIIPVPFVPMLKIGQYLEKKKYSVLKLKFNPYTKDINDIKKNVFDQLDEYHENKKIHFVGHSLGGLIILSYLSERKIPNLGNVVIMGSPIKGTETVIGLEHKWYVKFILPALSSLHPNGSQFLNNFKKPNYNLGVIAGNRSLEKSHSIKLKLLRSLIYLIRQNQEGTPLFTTPNDGIVSLESTKIEGMKDFIIMDVDHSSMLSDEKIFDQISHFLKYSKFQKEDE